MEEFSLTLDVATQDYQRLVREYNNIRYKAMALMFFVALNVAYTLCVILAFNINGLNETFGGIVVLICAFVYLIMMQRTCEPKDLRTEDILNAWKQDKSMPIRICDAFLLALSDMRELNRKLNANYNVVLIVIMLGTLICWLGIAVRIKM